MYGLPNDVDLSFLNGMELIQICVGQYQVQLHFFGGKGATISIEHRMTHRVKKKVTVWEEGKTPSAASSLLLLLGTSIVGVKTKEDGTLRLQFSNKDEVVIFDDSPGYEAYTINHGTDPPYVV